MGSSAPTAEPESTQAEGEGATEGSSTEKNDTPDVQELKLEEQNEPAPKGKGRVLFIYTCPSGSPIKFRMVYSSGVRGMQQDAADKSGVEISAKVRGMIYSLGVWLTHQLETSDLSDLTESHLRSSLPPSRPTHSSSLPTPTTNTSSTPPFSSGIPQGGQPTPFGGAFGRPRPMPAKVPVRSATQVPLPPSEATTPVSATPGEDEGDSKENIRKAFDAFGPRVNAGGGGGFARPRPAGRR